MQALAIKSANDIAVALAEHIGGSEARFGAMMTLRAQELGMAAFEARAAQSLAILWQSQGRLAEARALLASANKVAMIN